MKLENIWLILSVSVRKHEMQSIINFSPERLELSPFVGTISGRRGAAKWYASRFVANARDAHPETVGVALADPPQAASPTPMAMPIPMANTDAVVRLGVTGRAASIAPRPPPPPR